MNITLVQSQLYWEDIEKNLSNFEQKLETVEQTDLIILPEMFSTGFSMNAAVVAETMEGSAINWMRKTAAKQNSAITGSLIITEDGKFYNVRIREEKLKRMKFTDSRRNNLNPTDMSSHMKPHMDSHMENRNRNKAINTIESQFLWGSNDVIVLIKIKNDFIE
jgi:hypothetical protein